jgi:anti-sigma factor RsiW
MDQPITETDLQGYVDGQIDAMRRIAVEAWLQSHPDAAARVMQDLRQRDEIRAFLAEPAVPAAATLVLGAQLDKRLRRRRLVMGLRRGLAAAVLVGAGWLAHGQLGGTLVDSVAAAHLPPGHGLPDFVEEAAEAHRIAIVGGLALSGLMPLEDPDRLAAAAGPPPRLGEGFSLLGARRLATDDGEATQSVWLAPGGRHLTLFATARPAASGVVYPQAATQDGFNLVYWEAGRFAYALCGNLPLRTLLETARRMEGAPA